MSAVWTVVKKPDGTYEKFQMGNNVQLDGSIIYNYRADMPGPYYFYSTVVDPGDVTAPGFQLQDYYPLPGKAT